MRSKLEKKSAELKMLPNPDNLSCKSDTMESENSNKNNEHINNNRTKAMLLSIDVHNPNFAEAGFIQALLFLFLNI